MILVHLLVTRLVNLTLTRDECWYALRLLIITTILLYWCSLNHCAFGKFIRIVVEARQILFVQLGFFSFFHFLFFGLNFFSFNCNFNLRFLFNLLLFFLLVKNCYLTLITIIWNLFFLFFDWLFLGSFSQFWLSARQPSIHVPLTKWLAWLRLT